MNATKMKAIYDELVFWQEFVQWNRFLKGWVGRQKTPELNQFVADFIVGQPHHRIMDVGSGVVSIFHGLVPDATLLAVDPLGDMYRLVFDYDAYDLIPPMALSGEELKSKNEFDIVHMRNAIDHTDEPGLVYDNLLNAVRSGGYLIIQGFEHEGTAEHYSGLHQWDCYLLGDEFWIEGRGRKMLLGKSSCIAKRIKTEQGRDWFIWIVQK